MLSTLVDAWPETPRLAPALICIKEIPGCGKAFLLFESILAETMFLGGDSTFEEHFDEEHCDTWGGNGRHHCG
jgi:hypothetical protein